MLSDFAKKQIQRMEKEYEKLEQKALKCKSEKTEAKYLAKMESIQNAIARTPFDVFNDDLFDDSEIRQELFNQIRNQTMQGHRSEILCFGLYEDYESKLDILIK